MYDCTNPTSKRNVETRVKDVERVYKYNPPQVNVELGKFPMVICGNKCDLAQDYSGYITISTKTNENLYEPLLTIARALTNHPDLVFVE